MYIYSRSNLINIFVLIISTILLAIGLQFNNSLAMGNSVYIMFFVASLVFWPLNSYVFWKNTKKLEIKLPNPTLNIIFPCTVLLNKDINFQPFVLNAPFLGRFTTLLYPFLISVFVTQILTVTLFEAGLKTLDHHNNNLSGGLGAYSALMSSLVFGLVLCALLIVAFVVGMLSINSYNSSLKFNEKPINRALIFFFPYLYLSIAEANHHINQTNKNHRPYKAALH